MILKMKKSIFALAIVTCFIGTLIISCKPATKEEKEAQEKVELARDNVADARDTLNAAKKEAIEEEWIAFKYSGDSIIKINELRIAKLKLRMKNSGKSIDAEYQKNIDRIEQRNKDLKIKMDTYKNHLNSDWQSLKREFTHDTIPNN